MHGSREYVEAGGLMSYGPNTRSCFVAPPNMSTRYAGAKPGDLPVEQPTKFELVINLKAAKTLGLEIHRRSLPAPTR